MEPVADIGVEEGPVQISREDGQRRIGIELNIHDRDIGGYVAEAKSKIAAKNKTAWRLLSYLGRPV